MQKEYYCQALINGIIITGNKKQTTTIVKDDGKVIIKKQSPDISMGVDVGGAGDQGIMFGYATNETVAYMPLAIFLANRLIERATMLRKNGEFKWARPDMKSQVTIDYTYPSNPRINTILMSVQHDDDYNEIEFKNYIL